jgi:uncharacterized protein (DUF305 family)
MTPRIRSSGWSLTALIVLAACSGNPPVTAGPSPEAPAGARGDSLAVAKARADSARYPYTEADVQFMSAMIGHHAQALVMAGWVPTHGASPSIRTLAGRIMNGQQDEIATMQTWLRDRGKPVPEPNLSRSNGADSAGTHAHHSTDLERGVHHNGIPMHGMLSDDQMRQLDEARGPEFDRLFLTYMIQHHRGAVSMVRDLFGSQGAAQDETVFKFANDVSVDQSTEIARMEKMLEAAGGPGSP